MFSKRFFVVMILLAVLIPGSLFAQGKYRSTSTFSFTVADSGTIGADTDPTYALNHPYLSILYVVQDGIATDSAQLGFLIEFSDDATTFFTFDTLEVAATQDSIGLAYEYGPTEHPTTKYMRVRGVGMQKTRAASTGVTATARVTGWYPGNWINPYIDSKDGR